MAKIPASHLPARGLWPGRLYTPPAHRAYPQRLNSTEEAGLEQSGRGKPLRRILRDKLT
jgi:hypothetical protein